MTKIAYTPLAEQELDSKDKREARVHLNKDGSLQGWCITSSKKSVLWRVDGRQTTIGLASEANSI